MRRFRLNSPSPPSSPTSRFIRDIQKEHAEKDADGSGRSGRSLDGSGATALNQSVASSVGSRSSPPPEESRPSSPYKMLISDLVAGAYDLFIARGLRAADRDRVYGSGAAVWRS